MMFESRTKLKGGAFDFYPNWVGQDEAFDWFIELKDSLSWRQDRLFLFGRHVLAPRLSVWMGDAGLSYTYSHNTMTPQPWHPLVRALNNRVNAFSGEEFNSVLVNFYRDGNDSNGWHADDEPELGPDPIIASLSLGGTRDFKLRHKHDKTLKATLPLSHGSLLIMQRGMQTHWQHQIPKRRHAEPRINLTFRTIFPTH